MTRGFETGVKTLLSAMRIPTIAVLFEFRTLGLKFTNWPKSIVYAGSTYLGSGGTHKFSVTFEGFGENLDFEVPAAVMKIVAKDGYFQTYFLADQLRGQEITITLMYIDSAGAFQAVGWTTTYTCDADECDAYHVTLRLASSDAIHGTELPRRTTQQYGCQHDFQIGGCYYRFKPTDPYGLQVCDKGYDTPVGCKAHFKDVVDPKTGLLTPQPKPYSAFLGGVDHSIVRG